MDASDAWDWQVGKKVLADLAQIRSSYSRVDEFVVSPDGQQIATSAWGDSRIQILPGTREGLLARAQALVPGDRLAE